MLSLRNFSLFFFPLSARSNSCRALETGGEAQTAAALPGSPAPLSPSTHRGSASSPAGSGTKLSEPEQMCRNHPASSGLHSTAHARESTRQRLQTASGRGRLQALGATLASDAASSRSSFSSFTTASTSFSSFEIRSLNFRTTSEQTEKVCVVEAEAELSVHQRGDQGPRRFSEHQWWGQHSSRKLRSSSRPGLLSAEVQKVAADVTWSWVRLNYVPGGSTRALTDVFADLTTSFRIFLSDSPTRDTERPERPALAVRPTRWT